MHALFILKTSSFTSFSSRKPFISHVFPLNIRWFESQMSFLKINTGIDLDTVSDPMQGRSGSQIAITRGTVDHIKNYREQ